MQVDILEKVASSGYEAEQQAGLVQEGGAATDTGAEAGYTGRSLVLSRGQVGWSRE